jgi:hypothetical protein
MKLIILILANDTDLYLKMQEIWRTYMNSNKNIKSYFIKYDENLQDNIILQNETILIKGRESLIPGCLDKTIKSIEYLLKNTEFDFIFRTNMSSVVDLNNLYDLLNKDIKCGGVIGYTNNKSFNSGTNDNQAFVSGAGILINKELCNILVENKMFLNYNIMDDIAMGELLIKKNINFTPLKRFEVYNYESNLNLITKDIIKDHYHFRCKSDVNFNQTISNMEKIIEIIY